MIEDEYKLKNWLYPLEYTYKVLSFGIFKLSSLQKNIRLKNSVFW